MKQLQGRSANRRHNIRFDDFSENCLHECLKLNKLMFGVNMTETVLMRQAVYALRDKLKSLKGMMNSPAWPDIKRGFQLDLLQLAGKTGKPINRYFAE